MRRRVQVALLAVPSVVRDRHAVGVHRDALLGERHRECVHWPSLEVGLGRRPGLVAAAVALGEAQEDPPVVLDDRAGSDRRRRRRSGPWTERSRRSKSSGCTHSDTVPCVTSIAGSWAMKPKLVLAVELQRPVHPPIGARAQRRGCLQHGLILVAACRRAPRGRLARRRTHHRCRREAPECERTGQATPADAAGSPAMTSSPPYP